MRCHTKSVTIFATPTQRKKRQSSPSTNVVCVVYSCDQQKNSHYFPLKSEICVFSILSICQHFFIYLLLSFCSFIFINFVDFCRIISLIFKCFHKF